MVMLPDPFAVTTLSIVKVPPVVVRLMAPLFAVVCKPVTPSLTLIVIAFASVISTLLPAVTERLSAEMLKVSKLPIVVPASRTRVPTTLSLSVAASLIAPEVIKRSVSPASVIPSAVKEELPEPIRATVPVIRSSSALSTLNAPTTPSASPTPTATAVEGSKSTSSPVAVTPAEIVTSAAVIVIWSLAVMTPALLVKSPSPVPPLSKSASIVIVPVVPIVDPESMPSSAFNVIAPDVELIAAF